MVTATIQSLVDSRVMYKTLYLGKRNMFG